jgi:hypothetical protein
MKQIALTEQIAKDSETNKSESGNQALSPSSSLPLSQLIHSIQTVYYRCLEKRLS